MQRVFVLDKNKKALTPCHPARARQLLKSGRAKVIRKVPFTIILQDRLWEDSAVPSMRIKIDPGSRTTGIALVQSGGKVLWAGEVTHRGQQIKDALESRRMIRRNRRSRLRYRQPRFDNRRRPEGWLPPSLNSRVHNVMTWTLRLCKFSPAQAISMELVRFDMQKMVNPEISGVEYQQGELMGYEVREYLLEKWGRKCAYCGAKDVPLEIEHINPKSRGGSNQVSNLTLACTPCNQTKGAQTAAEFGFPLIQAKAKQPLKDAAAVNATRWKLWRELTALGLPVEIGTGGRTKFNRRKQNLPKTHWLDAACVGRTGQNVYVPQAMTALEIKATGHGRRQMCLMDKYGFPRTSPKQSSKVHGFQTGDMAYANVPSGKKAGVHRGRIAVRKTGYFRVGKTDGISHKYCQLLQAADGYEYSNKLKGEGIPHRS